MKQVVRYFQMPSNKKGQIVSRTVDGGIALVVVIMIGLVLVSTLFTANLLTSGSVEDNAATALRGNFTAGVDNISGKIPTLFLVAAVVLLIGILVLLRRQGSGTSGSSL